MQIPQSRTDRLKVRDTSPIYLTEAGARQLRERLERIQKSLPELIQETQRTAAYGDRSENAEYQTAKSALRRAHRQILSIQDQLKRVSVIKMGAGRTGKIQLGSTVVLEANGEQKTFQIVGPQETDPAKGRISHLSPLGSALLNHKTGESVAVLTGRGEQRYTIIEVR